MDLAARRSARQRNDFVMRVGAVLVTVGLLFSLVFQPPKAKAFGLTASAVVTITAAFLASCGLTWLVQGMDTSGFTDAVGGLLQDYLDSEFLGQTPLEWAGDVAAIATPSGKLQIPKILAQKVAAFANWVVGKYGVTAGGSAAIVSNASSVTLLDGTVLSLAMTPPLVSGKYNSFDINTCILGTSLIPVGVDQTKSFVFSDIYTIQLRVEHKSLKLCQDGLSFRSVTSNYDGVDCSNVMFVYGDQGLYLGVVRPSLGTFEVNYGLSQYLIPASDLSIVNQSVAISSAIAIDIPDTGTMADDDAWEIGVGAAGGLALDVLLQQILDAILAGNLAATGEIVTAEEITKPGEITDVDGLGLPALGTALTTRFPFSIPWDIVRGIKLIAAPAEAPYWEVDFLAPISSRVGGWQGDTTVVIDMGEFPLIGQVCRWTSTIGFCLLLASGTKKLIWVA